VSYATKIDYLRRIYRRYRQSSRSDKQRPITPGRRVWRPCCPIGCHGPRPAAWFPWRSSSNCSQGAPARWTAAASALARAGLDCPW